MKKNNDAVTPVVSIVLALFIITSAVASILLLGIPYIDHLRSEAARENAEMQFNTVVGELGNLVKSNPGEKKVIPLAVDEGSISVDKDESDRIILMYSYDEGYNFTVSGLDDSDNLFWITMIEGAVTRAEVYWLDDGRTCFLAGTKVAMGDGSYKNIESVQIGDRVKSYDEQTGEIVDCKVTHVFRHSPEEMTDYYLVINNALKVTPNHRFYSNGRWVFAGDLEVGDPLFCRAQNEDHHVYSIERIYERESSFDLEVERCHTYFVSIDDSVDVLVHNAEVIELVAEQDVYFFDDGVEKFCSFLKFPLAQIRAADPSEIISVEFKAFVSERGDNWDGAALFGDVKSQDWDEGWDYLQIWEEAQTDIFVPSVFDGEPTQWWTSSENLIEIFISDYENPANDYCSIKLEHENPDYQIQDPRGMENINLLYAGFFPEEVYIWFCAHEYEEFEPKLIVTYEPQGQPNNPPNPPINPSPEDGATGVGVDPILSVDVYDPDEDTMTVAFYQYTGPFTVPIHIDTVYDIPSGGTASVTWPGREHGTTYDWYATAYDGEYTTQSDTWSFTTEEEANTCPDAPINPSPEDSATDVGVDPTLSVDVSDPDSNPMDVTFYDASDDSIIGTDTNVPSGGTATTTWSGLNYETTYNWYAVADDGECLTQSDTWSFTTEEDTSGGYITITCPLAGYKWKRGTTQTITWSYTGAGTVDIRLYEGGTVSLEIGSDIQIQDENYLWEIPSDLDLGNNYRINISHTSESYYDFSDYFSIIELHAGISIHETCYPDDGEFSATKDFEGTMVIDLYNLDDNDYRFGTIWLFDSNSMTYKLSFSRGTYNVILENGGIIYSYPDKRYIKDAPHIYTEGNTFTMRIVQMIASSSSAYEGSGSNVRMNTNLYRNHIREKEYVYCFRLQFYGDNADAWLDYYDDTYDFMQEPPDTLFYEPSDAEINQGGVWFTLVHSIVGFSIW